MILIFQILQSKIHNKTDQFIKSSHHYPIQSSMNFNTSAHNSTGQNASDYLRQLATNQMYATEISLDFRALTNLLPILHLLSYFKRLKKLSLHGNRLTQLPTDLSKLSSIESLDISNNFLDNNVQLTIMSLKTLPNLKSLIYPVAPQKIQFVIEQLKSLEFFNNVKIQRKPVKKQVVYHQLNKKNMDEFLKRICDSYKQLTQFQEKYLDQKVEQNVFEIFKQDVSTVSKEYLDRLARSTENDQYTSPSLQTVMYYMAKFQIFDQLFSKALNLCQDVYGDFGNFIFQIFQQQNALFKGLSEQSLNLTRVEYDFKQQIEIQKKISEQKGQYLILNKNLTMQKEIKRLKKQKEELISQLHSVETQNKKLIDSLMKYAKGDNSVLSNFNGPLMKQNKLKNQQESILQTGNSSHRNMPLPAVRPNQKGHKANTATKEPQNLQSNQSTGGNRNLTLKQLKQTIQEIYESKLKFDQKNYDGKIARQTMHQYLFTYLNQKYGLKNLTIQAAASIVSGIQSYSSEDNDICVFGKILRNQIDEQFRFVQTQLKTTVTDLLKMHIKTKMPYKSATQVNQILNDKMNNEITWQEAEDIVKYLYNKQDSDKIIRKLDILFKINEKPADKAANRRLTRQQQAALMSQKHIRKLKFSQFMKCVLDFQLKNHEKLLKPLVLCFKKSDSDSDGVINEDQFIDIIQELCQQGSEIVPYLLNIVDPYEIKLITFTQMVRLVANYPQSSPILSRFIGQEQQEGFVEEDRQNSYN